MKTGINKHFFCLALLAVILSIPGNTKAQVVEDEKYDEFLIGNKLYKPYSTYFSLGYGYNWHQNLGTFEQSVQFGVHFRITDYHFQAGYLVSSDEFMTKRSMQKLNSIYLLTGWRKETRKYNVDAYAGPCFAYGATFDHAENVNGELSDYYRGFSNIGLYANISLTKKLLYDLGPGITFFTSLSTDYQVFGVQLHLYFSGAYKGSIE